mgnify:CR=1 FL=1|jgi:hypothetical protein
MFIGKMLPSAVLMLAVIGLILGQAAGRDGRINPEEDVTILENGPLPGVCSGDIIFRRGRSLVSTLVLLNDRESPFSHTGIVALEDGIPYVIHAVPGEPGKNGEELVKRDLLTEFLSPEKAAQFAVFRLKNDDPEAVFQAAAAAEKYYQNRLAFDKAFSIRSDDRLYCTELVWKAYLSAGLNLTGNRFARTNASFIADSLILPGHILNSPLLYEVYSHY